MQGVAELSSNSAKIQRLQEEIAELRRSVSEGGSEEGNEAGQLRKEKEAQTALLHQMRRNVSVVFR
jgi:flagellar biosynthesis/type III secretory pathway protein FliH